MTAQTQVEELRLADEAWRFDVSAHGSGKRANAEMLCLLQDCATTIRKLVAQAQLASTEAEHWRSNHDNLAARLRVFTQRPDLPKELADRLPWYRELLRLQELEAQPAPIAPGMKVAADLVQEQADLYITEHAETDPDTGAMIWHHRDFGFDWHNGLKELAQKLVARATAAPAAQTQPSREPLTDEEISDMRAADLGALNFVTLRQFRAVARAVEIAHGITGGSNAG